VVRHLYAYELEPEQLQRLKAFDGWLQELQA
jgi:hypothetical protein